MDPELSADFSVVELQEVIAPRLRGPVDGDSNAAQTACTALMFGLFHQRRTGVGQFLSTSMIGGNVYSYSDDAVTYDGKPPRPTVRSRAATASMLSTGSTRPGDGWVFLAATNDKERAALATTLGVELPDGDDARAAVLAAAFADRKADEVEAELTEAGVGCASVFPDGHPAFIATDEAIFDTGLAAEIEHPLFGTIRRHGLPAMLSETPGRIAPGSLRGQHTIPILTELGYTPEQIAGLEAKKVVTGPD